jgi:hypothetical protein
MYHGKVILCSSKCTRTGLWMIPLCPTPPASVNNNQANLLPTVIAANVDATSSAGEYVRYIHRALCSPLATTLIHVLKHSRELATVPSLTAHLINTHLATDKGHMKRHRQGIQSTRTMQPAIFQAQRNVDSLQPDKEICATHDMFCSAALTNLNTGTMYTNLPGTFPVLSFKSMQYVFIDYIYDLNAILVCAMPSKNDTAMITAFTKILATLAARGYKPHPECYRQQMFKSGRSIHQIQQDGRSDCPSP